MPTRRFPISLLPISLLAAILWLCLSPAAAHAQVSSRDSMQIDPPPLPRFRKVRPAFTVSADPNSKPMPIPPIVPPPTPAPTPSQLPPTKTELDKKAARQQAKQKEQFEADQSHDRLVNIGRVFGFLLVVGVGIFAATDIARQVRRARQAPPEDDWEDDEEP